MVGKSRPGLTGAIAASVGLALANTAGAQVRVLPVQGNVHMLAMGGANVVVQLGSDGVVVVDTSTSARAPEVLAAIRQLSDKTIRYVINTHEHPDHVGGNAVISQAGTSFG
jgi:cyclase